LAPGRRWPPGAEQARQALGLEAHAEELAAGEGDQAGLGALGLVDELARGDVDVGLAGAAQGPRVRARSPGPRPRGFKRVAQRFADVLDEL
jgi:hypothetical protein